jgi:hypothetical protein
MHPRATLLGTLLALLVGASSGLSFGVIRREYGNPGACGPC